MKTCPKCEKQKELTEFNKCKTASDGRQGKCRECEKTYREKNRDKIKARSDKYREENKELIKERNAIWAKNNKEKIAETHKQWLEKNRETERVKKQEYRKKNKERMYASQKRWKQENREHSRQWFREYTREQRKTNPQFVMRQRLTTRIRGLLNGSHKSASTEELLGCTYDEFKIHIESQFTDDMSWEIFMTGAIHLDHIRPCCSFDLTKPEEQRACFHYTNTRPLWAEDNHRKVGEDIKMKKKDRMMDFPSDSSV